MNSPTDTFKSELGFLLFLFSFLSGMAPGGPERRGNQGACSPISSVRAQRTQPTTGRTTEAVNGCVPPAPMVPIHSVGLKTPRRLKIRRADQTFSQAAGSSHPRAFQLGPFTRDQRLYSEAGSPRSHSAIALAHHLDRGEQRARHSEGRARRSYSTQQGQLSRVDLDASSQLTRPVSRYEGRQSPFAPTHPCRGGPTPCFVSYQVLVLLILLLHIINIIITRRYYYIIFLKISQHSTNIIKNYSMYVL